MRGTRRGGRGGQPHDLSNGLLGNRRLAAAALADLAQTGQPVGAEGLAPRPHRCRCHLDLFGDHRVGHPSAANNNTCARTTCRGGSDCARANLSSVSRSPSDKDNAAAAELITSEPNSTLVICETQARSRRFHAHSGRLSRRRRRWSFNRPRDAALRCSRTQVSMLAPAGTGSCGPDRSCRGCPDSARRGRRLPVAVGRRGVQDHRLPAL